MTGFVIASNSRTKNELLFMVDRTKQRRSFWSHSTQDVQVFPSQGAAEARVRTLKFNRPRVMPLAQARRISLGQAEQRAEDTARDGCESGWDAHKDVF